MAKSIAVAGKGGTGKSMIAALLISRLKARGEGPILAVDADPDSNLGTLLGMKAVKSIGDLREDVLKEIKELPAGMSRANYVEAGLHQIIDEAGGLDLVTMGRGEGSGCYCYLNSLIKKFSDDLTPSYSWLIMDNEAGLEHISRRTSGDIDALIVVVTDNPLSLHSALKIQALTDSLNTRIKNRYCVRNTTRNGREGYPISLEGINIPHIGDLPYDEGIEEAIFAGRSLTEIENSPLFTCIDLILDTVGGTHGNS